MNAPRIAVFLPDLTGGGAERVMVTLANGFAARAMQVDLVLVRSWGPYLADVDRAVRIVDLGATKVLTSLPKLVGYLRRERPAILLSTLNTANLVAICAARLSRLPIRTVVRQSNVLVPDADCKPSPTALLIRVLAGRIYPFADAVVAVSEGVADDMARCSKLRRDCIHVAPNPIVTPKLRAMASESLDHPWFGAGQPPVVLGAGRLTAQKDFATLIRAFARVREKHPARLMLLGEGEERNRLESLARDLGIEDDVTLPGFVGNPFRYMSGAAVFVLSSAWEGLPGVLIQALACGTPVVATDCESGPREILKGGRFGHLVPVGDVTALADAMLDTLLCRAPGCVPREAWLPFTEEAAVDHYLSLLSRRTHG